MGSVSYDLGTDMHLTLSSQYKRSAGRNLGDTRHSSSIFVFLCHGYFVYSYFHVLVFRTEILTMIKKAFEKRDQGS